MQQQEVIEKIVEFLETKDEFLWPLRKVLRSLGFDDVNEQALLHHLKDDERFNVQEGQPMFDDAFTPEERIQEELAMEELGYYDGPKIMLHSKAPTREQLFKSMAQQLKTMHDAIDRAIALNDDDPEAEKRLAQAKTKAQNLETQLKKLFQDGSAQN